MHKVGAIFVGAVDSMIISIFIGVAILGEYTNYTAICGAMTGIIVLFFTPVTSVIGHLCVDKEPSEIRKYFNYFYSMTYILGVIFFLGYYAVIDNIVEVFFGSYLVMLRGIPFIITLNTFIGYFRHASVLFKDASGMFYYDRWKPMVEGIVNIILSIVFVNIFPKGYEVIGVIAATIVTGLLICYIVENHILFKYVFKEPATKFYFLNYGRVILFALCMLMVDWIKTDCDNNIMEMLVNGTISIGISLAFLGLLSIFDRDFRQDARVLMAQAGQWCKTMYNKIKKNKD